MLRYTIRRILITIPIILIVAIAVFTLLYFTPGDPCIIICGDNASQAELDAMRVHLGLDRPYIVQLGDFLYRLFIKFDMGESWIYRTNISYELGNRLPRTVGICVYSVLISAVCGIPLGVAAAVNQDKPFDKFVLLLSSVMHCIPGFCISLILIIVFAVKLKWLPPYGIDQGFVCYILPCASILLGSFAGLSRQMRSSMLEVIRSDFVVSARAQGFSRNQVNYLHALPNALIPVITMLGGSFAAGLGGTMILETIFALPGVGLYIQGAISNRDVPIVLGCVTLLAIAFCIIMLGVDLLYAAVDPRIRAQYKEQGKGTVFRRRARKLKGETS